MSKPLHQPIPGVYVPLLTFFKSKEEGEEVDVETTIKHAKEMAEAGLGLVLLGSMGEAVHLSHSERLSLLRSVISSIPPSHPLIVGTGASSTKETIQFCVESAEIGAKYVMVIPPGYYVGALDKEAIKSYFLDVADASPVPVYVYNYPGASAGIDMDSDLLAELAQHPNIVGCKLTCGSVGKLTRLTSIPGFSVLGGFADFLLPGMFMKSAGCITGLANVTPRLIVRLHTLIHSSLSSPTSSDLQEAQSLQYLVSKADFIMARAGIAGTKALLEDLKGYGGVPRRPVLPYKGDLTKLKEDMKEALKVEGELEGKK